MNDPQQDIRRKRIRFRSCHRGTKEADLVLGGFTERYLATLDAPQLAMLEALLEVPDSDLMDWVTGRAPVPPAHDNPVMALLKQIELCPRQ